MADRYASLKQGLVGAWIPSISGSGLLLPDLSGRGNNGVLTNMDASDWVSGQYGRALDFDGSNDYAACNAVGGISQHVSVSVWFKSTTIDANFRFVCGNSNSAGAVIETHLEVKDNGIGPLWGSGPYYRPAPNLGLVASTWYHAVFLRYGATGAWTAQMYISGALAWTGTTAINPGAADQWSIGRSGTYNGPFGTYFNGQIADVMIYNRALSPSEIRLLASEPGIGFKPAKKLSRFSQRFTYKPPKPRTYGLIRNRDPDTSSLKQGLVGAWCPSISGQGNVLPDLVGGNHGTLTNMDASDWVSSEYGRALDFDGSNDYVSIPDSNQLDVTGPVSLAIWVRGTSTANKVLTEKGNNKTLVLQPNGANDFYYLDGFAGPAIVPGLNTLIFNGSWHNITATFNGATRSLYVDGALRHTSAMSTPSANADEFVIGARSGSSVAWQGQVDDVRVYNRALSESEIRLLASKRGIGLQNPRDELLFHQFPSGSSRRLLLTGQT